MKTAFAPYGGAYDSGHPWYYRLGGPVLTFLQIREKVLAEPIQDHHAEQFNKLDRMQEPKRSKEIRSMRASIVKCLIRDAKRYREVAREIRHLRTFIGPEPYDWFKQTYNEPTCALSLKHNHIHYGLRQLRAIDQLTMQPSLFDAPASEHKTELTPAGEQTVIPGCERNTTPVMTQLELFG